VSTIYTPKAGGTPTQLIPVRMPLSVLREVESHAEAHSKSRSYMIIKACRVAYMAGTENMPEDDHGDPEQGDKS